MTGGQMTAATFLVAELRRARMRRGWSQEDLAKAVNYSASMVSAVELGQQPPTPKYLEQFDKALDTGGLYGRMLTDLVALDKAQVWLRGAQTIVGQAAKLRWYEPLYVPGLLQTEAYARAVFEAGGLLDPDEVERRLTERMENQTVLSGDHSPHLIVIIDEAAIRRCVGDRKIVSEQVSHLADIAGEHPRIRVHVVPQAAAEYPGLGGPFLLASGRDGTEVAFLGSHIGGQELDRSEDLDLLRQVWEVCLGEAYTPRQTIELLREVAEAWS
ncbi:helix-turn-helix domain-containing protein [Micromonospora craniellae]|uniref:XRE family transcriptional regulator n=1 Tax=Micromonospora craniellae TaxID=2294034 RepID=A0A372FXL1_9ACTN|nr:helix-turn-helix transcriptional regulator [Micromonospora craniellae]QOC90031.1 helix-turn-helix transcriptional regulator [Micromonospora craniellae]RFS45230.1 XRE family transcriptional regulator [Micromonospora craniellae]